jgi:hypothetical protein
LLNLKEIQPQNSFPEDHNFDLGAPYFNLTRNSFSELHLLHLVTANCTLDIDNNVVLNEVLILRTGYVKDLEVHSNSRLLNFTANLLETAGRINMTGNFTNVEFFNLQRVSGDFYLVGDASMDCSWFDEHFINNVVHGTYRCVGNLSGSSWPG